MRGEDPFGLRREPGAEPAQDLTAGDSFGERGEDLPDLGRFDAEPVRCEVADVLQRGCQARVLSLKEKHAEAVAGDPLVEAVAGAGAFDGVLAAVGNEHGRLGRDRYVPREAERMELHAGGAAGAAQADRCMVRAAAARADEPLGLPAPCDEVRRLAGNAVHGRNRLHGRHDHRRAARKAGGHGHIAVYGHVHAVEPAVRMTVLLKEHGGEDVVAPVSGGGGKVRADRFAVDEGQPVAVGHRVAPVADYQFAAWERHGVRVDQVKHVVRARGDGHDDLAIQRHGMHEAALVVDVTAHEVHPARGSDEEAASIATVGPGEEPHDLSQRAQPFRHQGAADAVRPDDEPSAPWGFGPQEVEPGVGGAHGPGKSLVHTSPIAGGLFLAADACLDAFELGAGVEGHCLIRAAKPILHDSRGGFRGGGIRRGADDLHDVSDVVFVLRIGAPDATEGVAKNGCSSDVDGLIDRGAVAFHLVGTEKGTPDVEADAGLVDCLRQFEGADAAAAACEACEGSKSPPELGCRTDALQAGAA